MISKGREIVISKIGLGTYRFWDRYDPTNIEALETAVFFGCNFIDTASTYGDAELLIGDYVKNNLNNELIIATKAGYLTETIIESRYKLLENISKENGIHYRDSMHCIHPSFLEIQIEHSIQKLNKKTLDIFYIHSPENYLNHLTLEKAEESIIKGFEKLEELVAKGKIISYGVSSDLNLPNINKELKIGIEFYLKIKEKFPNFKYIQCPFNLLENSLSTKLKNNGLSTIDLIHSKGLKFVGNRPFLMHSDTGVIKIQDFKEVKYNEVDRLRTNDVLNSLYDELQVQLSRSEETNILEFPICKLIYENWTLFGNKSAVGEVLNDQFSQLVSILYDNNVPENIKTKLSTLYQLFLKIASKREYETSRDFITKFYTPPTYGGINYKVCEEYLQYGVDHVLVGMNKKEYVVQLKNLF